MKVIVSGGGTGGHIYPALTLIANIQKLNPQAEFLYVGTTTGLEADIVPREKIPFTTVDIAGFSRSLTLDNLKTMGKIAGSIRQSVKILNEFKPDLVIGTGGYVCGPILLTAAIRGIPTLVQEQNAIPGITNRILARFVRIMALGYSQAVDYLPSKKCYVTGNPIRDDVLNYTREDGIAEFNLDTRKLTILVSGGSRGAHTINEAMIGVHRHFYGNDALQIIHVTGKNEYEFVQHNLADLDLVHSNIHIYPYIYNMPKLLACTDIAVSRAGATTLAELTAKGIPAILIPYPFAAENHQEFNARALESENAAMVILNRDLTSEKLISALEDLVHNPQRRQQMKTCSSNLGKPEAGIHIAQLCLSLIRK